MVEPLICWLKFFQKGYTLTSNKLNLSSKWYADDATFVAHNVTDLNTRSRLSTHSANGRASDLKFLNVGSHATYMSFKL